MNDNNIVNQNNVVEQNEIVQQQVVQPQTRLKNTKLSIASLIFAIIEPLAILIASYTGLDFLAVFPYILVSLILAIISKCKYNDKLSFVVIIIDIVLIGLSILGSLILVLFLAVAVDSFIKGCLGTTA